MRPCRLPAGFWWRHVVETDSTLLWLTREAAAREEEFVAVSADFQTAGRGQRGTVWESDRGRNLLVGLRVRPAFLRAAEQFSLSEVTALAVAEALDPYTDGITVKWPNDVYWRDRKICGMLLEHRLQGDRIAETLVGPGINLNQETFRSDAPNPVSLRQITGRDVDRAEVLSAFFSRFVRYYRRLQDGERTAIDQLYFRRLYRRDGLHPYRDAAGTFRARIAAVEPSGHLVLQDGQGRLRRYAFKEVGFVSGELF